jgi:transcriptional regulator with XRE-family HTH domain
MAANKTALQRVRETMGFTSRRVAEALGVDISGFHRIETGENTPTRDTARKIWALYAGAVPLGVIYDPRHYESQEWSKQKATRDELKRTAKVLLRERPELELRIKRG